MAFSADVYGRETLVANVFCESLPRSSSSTSIDLVEFANSKHNKNKIANRIDSYRVSRSVIDSFLQLMLISK